MHELAKKRYQQLLFHLKCKIINKQFAYSMFLIFLAFCVVFFFCLSSSCVLCTQCCQCPFLIALSFSLTFIDYNIISLTWVTSLRMRNMVHSRARIWLYLYHHLFMGPSWSWSYASWIHNYLYNKCLSPLMLWVRTPFMARCIRKNIIW